MSTLDKLVSIFESFPGVGARQAKRFAYHVLTMEDDKIEQFSKHITELKGSVNECASCHRFFNTYNNEQICSICSSNNRDHNRLLILERDSDIIAVERAGVYDGLYFVLGGIVPLLNAPDNKRLRGGALKATVETRIPVGLSEIIIGFAVNPDGENTARFVESIIGPILTEKNIKISYLGRGLSTGSELEYADSETIKNALRNRS